MIYESLYDLLDNQRNYYLYGSIYKTKNKLKSYDEYLNQIRMNYAQLLRFGCIETKLIINTKKFGQAISSMIYEIKE